MIHVDKKPLLKRYGDSNALIEIIYIRKYKHIILSVIEYEPLIQNQEYTEVATEIQQQNNAEYDTGITFYDSFLKHT